MEIPRLLILKARDPSEEARVAIADHPYPSGTLPQDTALSRDAPFIASPATTPADISTGGDDSISAEPEMRMGDADQIEEARRFGELGKAMRLIDPERPHQAHLVGPDLADPARWRHTTLVDDQPWEDAEFSAAEDAFLAALRAGGIPQHTDVCSDE